jgi:hypothetical protein
MAVLPTPGSPISTGLFLVRRCSTWIGAADLVVAADDRIELALVARSVRSMVYFSAPGGFSSAFGSFTFSPPRISSMAFSSFASGRAGILQQRARAGPVFERREHEQLAGDELVAALLRQLVGDVQQRERSLRDMHLAGSSLRPWAAGRAPGPVLAQQLAEIDPGLGEQVASPSRPAGRAAPPAGAGSMIWLSRPTASDWASARAIWKRLVSLSIAHCAPLSGAGATRDQRPGALFQCGFRCLASEGPPAPGHLPSAPRSA